MMKKIVFMSMFIALASVSAFASDNYYKTSINTCDEGEMRAALDKATSEKRAVITIVECENGVVTTRVMKNEEKPGCCCNTCGAPKEEVVKREYFVRETVQKYKPVVKYVPDGTYTRVKPVCNHGC